MQYLFFKQGLNLKITTDEIEQLESKYAEIDETIYDNIFDTIRQVGLRTIFEPLIRQAKIMVKKYEVVCTNPPYMNAGGMSPKLNSYAKKYYPNSKSDLCTVFIEKCNCMNRRFGYQAMITQHSWMFLSSYVELRKELIQKTITPTMIHLGTKAFDAGEVGTIVQTVSFVRMKINSIDYNGSYYRLVDLSTPLDKEQVILKRDKQYHYCISNNRFFSVPNCIIAYWLPNTMLIAFEGNSIGDYGETKKGILSGKNEKFVRLWYEVSNIKVGFHCKNAEDIQESKRKWFPITSGGFRNKWYGNLENVVNLENNAWAIRNESKNNYRLRENKYYCQESCSWSEVAGNYFSVRYVPQGVTFGNGGPVCFSARHLLYIIGFLNSKVAHEFLLLLAPTLNFGPEQVKQIPLKIQNEVNINELVSENIVYAKDSWNSKETSWEFEEHSFNRWAKQLWDTASVEAYMHHYYCGERFEVDSPLELCFMLWQGECKTRFNNLKRNEELLNSIFIELYGLKNELKPEIENKDVIVCMPDLQRDMRSFISYAVGCMFGRYSLDTKGLTYAGGEWDGEKYKTFIPDEDNCIPITDTAYFEDDIVGRFCEFVKVVYGEDTLEANLEFVAKALGNKGNTSRDIIRNYFLNDFFKDHCKIYQKRPIYWLFDSGKQNGFKALVYMHRWNADTIGNMRVEYLHRIQRTYEKEIEREQDTIDNTSNNRDRAAASKRKEKLLKQLKEAKDYDAKVAHLALSRPDIDLDDGVKVNYEKVQTGQDGKKLQILAKI